jgi:hypothetical protein
MPIWSKHFSHSYPSTLVLTTISLVPYCRDEIPEGTIDPGEFYMTRFHDPNGANNFPLQSTDNHYSSGTEKSFVAVTQCHVDVTRRTGDQYGATYYDASNNVLGEASGDLHNDGERLVLTPPEGGLSYTSLIIIRTGEMGRAGTKGSKINFESSFSKDGYSDPQTDIRFDTEMVGWDTRFETQPDEENKAKQGRWCRVPNIEDTESYSIQKITCYYPCTF